jgi:hypothetical protein
MLQNALFCNSFKTFFHLRFNSFYRDPTKEFYFSKKFFKSNNHFKTSEICQSNKFNNSFIGNKNCIFENIQNKNAFRKYAILIAKNIEKLNKKLKYINKYKCLKLENLHHFNRIFRFKNRNSIKFLIKKGLCKKIFGKTFFDICKFNRKVLGKIYDEMTMLCEKRMGRIDFIIKKFIYKASDSVRNIFIYKKPGYFSLDKNILERSSIKIIFKINKNKELEKVRLVSVKKFFGKFLEKSKANLKKGNKSRIWKFMEISIFNRKKKINIRKDILGKIKKFFVKFRIGAKLGFFSNKQTIFFPENKGKNLVFKHLDLKKLKRLITPKINLFTKQTTEGSLEKIWAINNYSKINLKKESLLVIYINNNTTLIIKIIKFTKIFLENQRKMIGIIFFSKIFSNFYEKILFLGRKKEGRKLAIIKVIYFQKNMIQKLININLKISSSYTKKNTLIKTQYKIKEKIFIFEKKLKKIKSIQFCEKNENKNKLIESLKQRLNCPIKYNLEKDVVLTKCGHSFSSTCIKDLIQKRNRKCPLCGQQFGLDTIKTLFLI